MVTVLRFTITYFICNTRNACSYYPFTFVQNSVWSIWWHFSLSISRNFQQREEKQQPQQIVEEIRENVDESSPLLSSINGLFYSVSVACNVNHRPLFASQFLDVQRLVLLARFVVSVFRLWSSKLTLLYALFLYRSCHRGKFRTNLWWDI